MEWLSDEEQSAWRPFVGLLFRFPALLDAQLQKDAGISHFEYMVLSSLSEAPDRALRMSQLAAMASGSVSRLSHVVSRLEAKGWVRREPSPGDGRFISAVLTEPGWQKVVDTAPGHVAAVRRLLIDTLTPEELRSLGHTSERILKAQGFKPLSRTVRALRINRKHLPFNSGQPDPPTSPGMSLPSHKLDPAANPRSPTGIMQSTGIVATRCHITRNKNRRPRVHAEPSG